MFVVATTLPFYRRQRRVTIVAWVTSVFFCLLIVNCVDVETKEKMKSVCLDV
jgi:hypothetical protein